MATVPPLSGSSSADGSAPRGPTYQLATRELSADFTAIGSEHGARDLGAVDGARFLQLLEKLVAIDAVNLVDNDPQLFVTAKSGRFLIQPQSGKLLVRPTNALDQVFFRLNPAEIPPFLDGTPPPQPKAFTSLIGSAAAHAETFAAPRPASPEKKSSLPLILLAGLGVLVVGATLSGWFYFRAPAPLPPLPPIAQSAPPPKFDLIPPLQLASLQKRIAGTYATSGEAGERLLELRADGTFRYQEFGSSLAVTHRESGPYTFAFRHGTQTPVLRAGELGAIEMRDENSLVVRDIVFTRLPAPAK
jgi:hypothetical protein